MKSIKLTENHKSKLLEMCLELFREESEINSIQNFRISNDYVLGLSDHTLYCENRDISENQYDGEEVPENELLDFYTYPINCFDINIHWFEFCMTHLFYELYDNGWRKENPNCVTDFHLDLHNFKYHPIDYLYKEFKKLK